MEHRYIEGAIRLRNVGLTDTQIAELLGLNPRSLRVMLWRSKQRGEVTDIGIGMRKGLKQEQRRAEVATTAMQAIMAGQMIGGDAAVFLLVDGSQDPSEIRRRASRLLSARLVEVCSIGWLMAMLEHQNERPASAA